MFFYSILIVWHINEIYHHFVVYERRGGGAVEGDKKSCHPMRGRVKQFQYVVPKSLASYQHHGMALHIYSSSIDMAQIDFCKLFLNLYIYKIFIKPIPHREYLLITYILQIVVSYIIRIQVF